MPKFRKFQDFAATMPLVVLYFVWIAEFVPNLASEFASLRQSFSAVLVLNVLYEIATILFLSLVVSLFALRRLPQNRAKGALPRAAAIVGANLQLLFLTLPQVQNGIAVLAVSTAVTVIGLAGSIYFASVLGRSFSILPQARGLVTTGPYRFVRHPLYIAEQVAVFGIMWQFQQPWAFLIFAASVAAQFPRMHYEEKVLSETYPAYWAYMARTGRLFPRAWVGGFQFPGNRGRAPIAIDANPLVE
ncbi:MAG TPA: isoprenylcysteine carboxylmethyltransferase family protein [Micropepsaceae bacterium]|nr:isoprenylcysteine carboxylmethyltransferase family protein [Micropepsaceae bacterium]